MDSLLTVSTLREFFATDRRGCVTVYLFGSVARGEQGPRSDVDVAVLLEDEPPPTLEGLGLALQSELEGALGSPVEVVVLNRAPADLVHRVLRDGILILDHDPSTRIRFEVQKRNEFFDLQPHLNRYRQTERVS